MKISAENAIKNDIFHRRYNGLVRYLRREYGLLGREVSIGFFNVGDHEYQLFFKACLFDKKLLKSDPQTGGLVVNAKKRRKR